MSERSWDHHYDGQSAAPWDIGRPQQAIAALAEVGAIGGTVLDVGCGTGEHALLASKLGCKSYGIDISPPAIEIARRKAKDRELDVIFKVVDALHLETLAVDFDTIIDSGLFHVFDDAQRTEYIASLHRALRPGGVCYVMCFSDRQPGEMGPRRISTNELKESFGEGWTVEAILATKFEVAREPGYAEAWLATVKRNP